MANSYPGNNIPTAKPSRRTIDIRSLSYGLSGAEQPYPVYQFAGGHARFEYPGHNPFQVAAGAPPNTQPAPPPTLPTPVISLPTGGYTGPQTVTISEAQAGVPIYYTLDGSTPTPSSPVYQGTLTLPTTTTVSAYSSAKGYTDSAVAVSVLTITGNVQPPTASPAAGTYAQTGSLAVSLADSTPGATIYYTTDGSTPTTSSTVYAGPFNVSGTTQVKAFATALGYTPSTVASFTYVVIEPTVAMPTISPAPGNYAGVQTCTIATTTSGASIYYTTDGSTPTTASTLYTGPFSIPTVNVTVQTINAIAVKSGYLNSGVTSKGYTFLNAASPVTFSPAPGTYVSGTTVTLSCATPGETIYYTTDGTLPLPIHGSTQTYSGPITVSASQTIIASAFGALGYNASNPTTGVYTVGSTRSAIISYLQGLAGKFVLSGQTTDIFIGAGGTLAQANASITPLQAQAGELPAIIGVILDGVGASRSGSYPPALANQLVANQWAAGGLSQVSLYLGAPMGKGPCTDGGLDPHTSGFISAAQLHQLATPGTTIYNNWQGQLAWHANALKTMVSQGAGGIVILLRIFIEINGNFFPDWYGGITGGTAFSDMQAVQKQAILYFDSQGLHDNLIHVYSANQNVGGYTDYFPQGDANRSVYMDCAGLDVYADGDAVHNGSNGLADYANLGNAYSLLSSIQSGIIFYYPEIGFHATTGCSVDEIDDQWYLQLIQQYTPKAIAFIPFCDIPSGGTGYQSLPSQKNSSALLNNAAIINLADISIGSPGGGGGTGVAPTLVQQKDNEGPTPGNTPESSLSTAFSSNVAAGNFILGLHTIATYAGQHPALQFSDTAGDTVSILQQILNPSANQMGSNPSTNYSQQIEMVDVPSAVGGATTLQVLTPTADQDYQAMWLSEWANVSGIAGQNQNNQAGVVVGQPWVGIAPGTALTSGTVTVTAAQLPATLVAVCFNQSGLGTSASLAPTCTDSGATTLATLWKFGGSKAQATIVSRTITTAGTYSANFATTSNVNESYMTQVAVLAGTTSGGGGGTTPPGKAQNLIMTLQGQHTANTSVYDSGTGFWDAPYPNSTSISWTSATPGTNPISGNNIWRSTNGAAPVQLNTGGLNNTLTWVDDTATLSINSTVGSSAPYYVANTYQYFIEEIDSTGASSGLSAQQSYYWYKNGVKHGIGGDFSGTNGGSVTVNYNDTTHDPNGAITFTWTGSYGYFLPWAGNEVINFNFWAGAYAYLSFDYLAITETNVPQFAIDRAGDIPIYNRLNGTNGASTTVFSLSPYGPAPVKGTWITYKLPLASLLQDYGPPSAPYANPVIQYSMYKFLLQSSSGLAGSFGVRNIVFTPT